MGAQMTLHFFDIFKVDTAAITSDNTSAQRIIQYSSVAFKVEIKDALNSKPFCAMRTGVVDQMRAMDLFVIVKRILSVEDLRTKAASSVRNVELEFVFYPLQPFLPPMAADIVKSFPAIVW